MIIKINCASQGLFFLGKTSWEFVSDKYNASLTLFSLSSPETQCLAMHTMRLITMVTRLLVIPGAAPVTEAGLGTAPRVAKLQGVPGLFHPCNHHHHYHCHHHCHHDPHLGVLCTDPSLVLCGPAEV